MKAPTVKRKKMSVGGYADSQIAQLSEADRAQLVAMPQAEQLAFLNSRLGPVPQAPKITPVQQVASVQPVNTNTNTIETTPQLKVDLTGDKSKEDGDKKNDEEGGKGLSASQYQGMAAATSLIGNELSKKTDDEGHVSEGGAALKGAGTGASIGTSILPGWGTLIGAVVGAGAGYFSSVSKNNKVDEQNRKIQGAIDTHVGQSNMSTAGKIGMKKGGLINPYANTGRVVTSKQGLAEGGHAVAGQKPNALTDLLYNTMNPNINHNHPLVQAAKTAINGNLAAMGHAPIEDEGQQGGQVKGPGTTKSDDVPAELPAGAFVVPAENASIAKTLREQHLGGNGNQKMKDGGNVPVALSNKEHVFMPEEVKILESKGIDLSRLAPNAEKTGKGYQKGGPVYKKPGYKDGTPKGGIQKPSNLSEYEQLIVDTARANGITDSDSITALLAIADNESNMGKNMKEINPGEKGNNKNYADSSYTGRGFVQITHEENYRKATDYFKKSGRDIDLVKNPELANDPKIAAEILVVGSKEGWWTGKKLEDVAKNKNPEEIYKTINPGADDKMVSRFKDIYTKYQSKSQDYQEQKPETKRALDEGGQRPGSPLGGVQGSGLTSKLDVTDRQKQWLKLKDLKQKHQDAVDEYNAFTKTQKHRDPNGDYSVGKKNESAKADVIRKKMADTRAAAEDFQKALVGENKNGILDVIDKNPLVDPKLIHEILDVPNKLAQGESELGAQEGQNDPIIRKVWSTDVKKIGDDYSAQREKDLNEKFPDRQKNLADAKQAAKIKQIEDRAYKSAVTNTGNSENMPDISDLSEAEQDYFEDVRQHFIDIVKQKDNDLAASVKPKPNEFSPGYTGYDDDPELQQTVKGTERTYDKNQSSGLAGKLLNPESKDDLRTNISSENQKSANEKTGGTKVFDALGGYGGLIALGQTAFGLYQLAHDKEPKPFTPDPVLTKMRDEAILDSNRMDPAIKSAAETNLELTRRSQVENIQQMAGGDTGLAVSNIRKAGIDKNRGIIELAAGQEGQRLGKKQFAAGLAGKVAGERRQAYEDQYEGFLRNHTAAAGLVNTGLSNLIGSQIYKDQRSRLDKATAQPEITFGDYFKKSQEGTGTN